VNQLEMRGHTECRACLRDEWLPLRCGRRSVPPIGATLNSSGCYGWRPHPTKQWFQGRLRPTTRSVASHFPLRRLDAHGAPKVHLAIPVPFAHLYLLPQEARGRSETWWALRFQVARRPRGIPDHDFTPTLASRASSSLLADIPHLPPLMPGPQPVESIPCSGAIPSAVLRARSNTPRVARLGRATPLHSGSYRSMSPHSD